MTTKELIKKLENKSPFKLAWAMLWRGWVLVLGVYLVLALFLGVLIGLGSAL